MREEVQVRWSWNGLWAHPPPCDSSKFYRFCCSHHKKANIFYFPKINSLKILHSFHGSNLRELKNWTNLQKCKGQNMVTNRENWFALWRNNGDHSVRSQDMCETCATVMGARAIWTRPGRNLDFGCYHRWLSHLRLFFKVISAFSEIISIIAGCTSCFLCQVCGHMQHSNNRNAMIT